MSLPETLALTTSLVALIPVLAVFGVAVVLVSATPFRFVEEIVETRRWGRAPDYYLTLASCVLAWLIGFALMVLSVWAIVNADKWLWFP